MATNRIVDGLNLQAMIDDLLVANGILKEDNSRIVVGHDNPRTEIFITKMPADEQLAMEGFANEKLTQK